MNFSCRNWCPNKRRPFLGSTLSKRLFSPFWSWNNGKWVFQRTICSYFRLDLFFLCFGGHLCWECGVTQERFLLPVRCADLCGSWVVFGAAFIWSWPELNLRLSKFDYYTLLSRLSKTVMVCYNQTLFTWSRSRVFNTRIVLFLWCH